MAGALVLAWLAIGVAAALGQSSPTSSAPGARGIGSILAHGNDEHQWVALVIKSDRAAADVRTLLYTRKLGESRWRAIPDPVHPAAASAALGLSNRQSDAVLRLAGGQIVSLWPGGGQLDQPLAGNVAVAAITSTGGSLWAAGRVPGGMSALRSGGEAKAATSSSTRGSSGVELSEPAASKPPRLVLFEREPNEWSPRVELPGDAKISGSASISMIIDGMPMVAWTVPEKDGAGSIRVLRLSAGAEWLDVTPRSPGQDIERIALLQTTRGPRLWTAPRRGAGTLRLWNQSAWSDPITLTQPPELRDAEIRDLATAIGSIRCIYLHGEQVMEQTYDLDGAATGSPTPLALPMLSSVGGLSQYVNAAVMIALTFAAIATLRRRGAIQRTVLSADAIPLARHGRRLLGGLIDLFPMLLVTPFVLSLQGIPLEQAVYDTAAGELASVIGLASYLAHTALFEMLFTRSIGKMVVGLRVVALDGTRPTPGALLARNFLRIVDVALVLLPLALILYSPLRQRIGDIAGGTLVIDAAGRIGALPPPLPDDASPPAE